jgi:diguanylate cyclase (GGDEF)-like protein
MAEAGSAAERYERLKQERDMVRRTALLLSADLPLHELLRKLAALLAAFVDATIVQVAIGTKEDVRFDYVFSDGIDGRPLDPVVRPDGATAKVLRSGKPALYRNVSEWPAARIVAFEGSRMQRSASAIFVPIPFGGRTVGVLSVQSREANAYDEDDVALLESCVIYLGARFHDEELRAASESLKQIATTDALTGLANRRSFDETLLHEWRRCARAGASLALAMIDVDYFKAFNDAYGHVAGDACLRQIAEALAGCTKRPADFASRYGGEEFALILPESDADGAAALAESICRMVAEIAIPHEGSSLGVVTLSIGIVALIPVAEEDPQRLIAAADGMLYQAKNGGRNRIVADGHRKGSPPAAEPRVIVRHNLPRYLTPIIARKRSILEVVTLLHSSPLASIVGPGGIGKTRLAVRVAEQLLEAYPDGIWFVDLAPLDDPTLVPSAIAKVFDIADEGGAQPLIERVGAVLKTKKLLVVLDNCEHVLSAASDAARELLRDCPEIRFLATSREPLGIAGEKSYRMPSLSVPPEGEDMSAERVMHYAAAVLFVTRAQAAHSGFTLTDENAAMVAEIVRRLDGIALAIELAAARVKILSLQQLTLRLDERFKILTGGSRTALPRQQTLRALIGWSYDLLNEAEQSLLRQLAIFRGGCALEAVEAVCIDERVPKWDVLDLLSALVDKSLVVPELKAEGEAQQRYRLLESTRAFALECLVEEGERESVAARHCRYFSELAQSDNDAYWQTDSDLWIARVRRELENYRAAIEWGLGGGDVVAAAAIVASLRWLWFATARREGRVLIERATALLPENAPRRVQGLLMLAEVRLNYTSARTALPAERAAEMLSGGIDDFGRAEALAMQGFAHGFAGRLKESEQHFEEALGLAEAANVPRLTGWVLSMLAYWVSVAGNRERARQLFDLAAVLLHSCEAQRQLAVLQANRAEFLFSEGDFESALSGARAAASVFRLRSELGNLSVALRCAAACLLASGDFEQAWGFARESLELARQADDKLRIAISIGHLAHLAAETGDYRKATRLLGFTDAVYRKNGNVRMPTEQRGYDRALELLHANQTEERIEMLISDGAAMEHDAAVAEAMAILQPSALEPILDGPLS